jgi:plastocyanin
MIVETRSSYRSAAPIWAAVVVAIVALAVATAALTATVVGRSTFGMMGGGTGMTPARGMMSGGVGPGSGSQPGSAGFVPGTVASPRVVRLIATMGLRFVPGEVVVKRGETITFEVTSMGLLTHEFMVGPAADVAADKPGTPEVADIGMMDTGSVIYTFDGPGPYAFACHATGHYEAGMAGTITLVP